MADISGYLKTIRDGQSGETVRDAIINCMRDINEDGQVKKASLVITKPDNVTYKPGKGKAFSSVTVNITGGESDPNKTIHYETLTVTELTENGTYPTEEQPDTYYDKVEVAIDWDKVSHPSNLGEEAEMTTYETDENGNKYWDAQLAGFDYVKRIWIPNSIASGLPGGDYPGGGGGAGPFKVTFYDRLQSYGVPSKIKDVTVEKNGDAAALFNADGGKLPDYGGTFLRWDPPVDKVVKSMNTYARYYTPQSGSPVQIPKTWEEILSTSDHSEFIGKFAWLDVKSENEQPVALPENQVYTSKTYSQVEDPQTYETLTINHPKTKFMVPMQCVAVGEGGTRSSWLAMDPLPVKYVTDGNAQINSYLMLKTYYGTDDWNSCYLHNFFEKCLIKGFPSILQSNIRYVTKWTWGAAQYPPIAGGNTFMQKASTCRLWIPSIGEINGMMTDYTTGGGGYPPELREPESGAVNYSRVWIPNGFNDESANLTIHTRSLSRLAVYGGNIGSYRKTGSNKVFESLYPDFGTTLPTGIYIGFCL